MLFSSLSKGECLLTDKHKTSDRQKRIFLAANIEHFGYSALHASLTKAYGIGGENSKG